MKESEEDERPRGAAWFERLALALILAGITIIVVFIIAFLPEYALSLKGGSGLPETGQVGDFIGGVVGAIWALAGVFLFYAALKFQAKEFRSQREQLSLQMEELRSQKEEFGVTRVTNVIYRQLDMIYERAAKLELVYPSNQHLFTGESVIGNLPFAVDYALDSYYHEIERCEPKERQKLLHTFTDYVSRCADFTLSDSAYSHLLAIEKTLDVVRMLISSKAIQSSDEVCDPILSDASRNQLASLLESNLQPIRLKRYFKSVLEINKYCEYLEKNVSGIALNKPQRKSIEMMIGLLMDEFDSLKEETLPSIPK